jgi:hypothetical protein
MTHLTMQHFYTTRSKFHMTIYVNINILVDFDLSVSKSAITMAETELTRGEMSHDYVIFDRIAHLTL